MEKFLSRKFLVSLLVVLSVILKHAFGIELTDSTIEYVVDAIAAVLAALGYVVTEGAVDKQKVQLPQDGADLG